MYLHLEIAPNPATMALVPSGMAENSSIGRHIVNSEALNKRKRFRF